MGNITNCCVINTGHQSCYRNSRLSSSFRNEALRHVTCNKNTWLSLFPLEAVNDVLILIVQTFKGDIILLHQRDNKQTGIWLRVVCSSVPRAQWPLITLNHFLSLSVTSVHIAVQSLDVGINRCLLRLSVLDPTEVE